jgi:hypothetical protein
MRAKILNYPDFIDAENAVSAEAGTKNYEYRAKLAYGT